MVILIVYLVILIVYFVIIIAKCKVNYGCMYLQISADALNFRLWYESLDHLQIDEEKDLFPPCFKLKVINKDYNPSQLNLVYKYKICIQSKKREDKHLTLNISGFGQFLNKGLWLLAN